MTDEIVFPAESIDAITEKAAEKTLGRIDFKAIQDAIFARIPTPENGRNLVMTQALRADIIDSVARLIPPGEPGKDGEPGRDGRDGANYVLTEADRESIAIKVRADIDSPAIDEIIDRVVKELDHQGFLVSSATVKARLDAIRRETRKKIINAGISGGDMIEEISKILGEDWRSGGTGIVEFNVQTGNYSLLSTDVSRNVEFQNGASDYQLTVNPSLLTDFPVGASAYIDKTGTGDITVARAGGMAFSSDLGDVDFKLDGPDISGRGGRMVQMVRRSASLFKIFGTIKSAS